MVSVYFQFLSAIFDLGYSADHSSVHGPKARNVEWSIESVMVLLLPQKNSKYFCAADSDG